MFSYGFGFFNDLVLRCEAVVDFLSVSRCVPFAWVMLWSVSTMKFSTMPGPSDYQAGDFDSEVYESGLVDCHCVRVCPGLTERSFDFAYPDFQGCDVGFELTDVVFHFSSCRLLVMGFTRDRSGVGGSPIAMRAPFQGVSDSRIAW